MSVITQLDTLMERVIAEEGRNYDLLADTRRMSVSTDENGEVVLATDGPDTATESFLMNDHALGQMSTDLGIPKRYFDRMREADFGLFRTNVHHWMYTEPNRRMIRAKRGGSPEGYDTLDRSGLGVRPLPAAGQHRDRDETPARSSRVSAPRSGSTTPPSPTRGSTSGRPSPRWRRRSRSATPCSGASASEQRGRRRRVRDRELRSAPPVHNGMVVEPRACLPVTSASASETTSPTRRSAPTTRRSGWRLGTSCVPRSMWRASMRRWRRFGAPPRVRSSPHRSVPPSGSRRRTASARPSRRPCCATSPPAGTSPVGER